MCNLQMQCLFLISIIYCTFPYAIELFKWCSIEVYQIAEIYPKISISIVTCCWRTVVFWTYIIRFFSCISLIGIFLWTYSPFFMCKGSLKFLPSASHPSLLNLPHLNQNLQNQSLKNWQLQLNCWGKLRQ